MATYQGKIGWRATRHAVVESIVHAEDVELQKERRDTYWLAVEVPQPANHHVVEALGGGMYFIRNKESGQLEEVNGADFIPAMDAWVASKRHYLRQISDPKCKDGIRWKKTRTYGVQGVVVTASPWWSNLIYEAARAGEADKVKALSRKMAVDLKSTFEAETHRQVLSVQVHYDTTTLHAHIFSTRIGDDQKFLPGTSKSLGMIGPWSCAVLRQSENGFIPRNCKNHLLAQKLVDINKARTGKFPLDFTMCRLVDNLCFTAFGLSPRLSFWRQAYEQGLPALSYNRLLAMQKALTKQVDVWNEFLTRNQDYAPSEVVLNRVGQRNVIELK